MNSTCFIVLRNRLFSHCWASTCRKIRPHDLSNLLPPYLCTSLSHWVTLTPSSTLCPPTPEASRTGETAEGCSWSMQQSTTRVWRGYNARNWITRFTRLRTSTLIYNALCCVSHPQCITIDDKNSTQTHLSDHVKTGQQPGRYALAIKCYCHSQANAAASATPVITGSWLHEEGGRLHQQWCAWWSWTAVCRVCGCMFTSMWE